MQKVKKIFLLAFLLISFANIAQIFNGANCNLATTIPNTGTVGTIDQQSTNGWLSFTAQYNTISIKINNIANGTTFGKITKVNIYSGNCNGLNLIATNSISINDVGSLELANISLIAGNVYYIETEKSFNGSQCTSGACTDNALYNLTFAPLACGWNWGVNPPTLSNYISNSPIANFNGFDAACFVIKGTSTPPGPDFPNFQNLNKCEVSICQNSLYVGYSDLAGSLGSYVIPNYTIFIFNGSPLQTQSLVVTTNTAMLTFTATGSYTIACSNSQCSPPPALPNATLTPYSPEMCSCTQLIINYLGSPNCNFTFSPTPICSGQPFCFFNVNQNPSQFQTI
jgi:hypothetical protein